MLTFLHTSPTHVHTFDALLQEQGSEIAVRHIVAEQLLQEVREAGGVTESLQQNVEEILLMAVEQGARVVVCTCSSIGSIAEEVNEHTEATIMRIDRPMASEAVRLGSRIVIAATLATTLAPTRALIEDAAQKAKKEIQVIELLCSSAWHYFEQGDLTAYLREIAGQLQDVALQSDVIVLAQASMARAIGLCPDLPVPVLTSPLSGLKAALQCYDSLTPGL